MNVQQTLIALLAQLGMALCLAGILLRRRFWFCRCFSLYLAACLLGNLSVALWPDQFFTMPWWIGRQITYAALRLATALEVVYWSFVTLPGAHRSMRRVLLAVLGVTFLSLVLLPDGQNASHGYDFIVAVLQPRMLNGTIWLFAASVGVSLLYRIPLGPWQQAIMTGFATYLTIFTILLRLMDVTGWDRPIFDLLNALDPIAYIGLLAYWTWAAWRTDPAPEVVPEVVQALQPWRV